MKKWIIGLVALVTLGAIAWFTPVRSYIENMQPYDTKMDSLFMGMYFGMESKVFYDHCNKLNKNMGTVQGTQNASVLYQDKENFKLPVDMNFYPLFNDKGEIMAMPIYFNYNAWAPWNKELDSKVLILEVKALMEKWYGPGFSEKQLAGGHIGYYKKEGPRLITMRTRDEQFVDVSIENSKYAPKEDKK
jgi:hypothetical protein